MKTLAQIITDAVGKVAPVHGVSIGRKQQKETWRIDFTDEVTPEQRKAAQAIIDGFDLAGETDRQQLQARIYELEIQQTPRRLREASLGQDNGWLKKLNDEIELLRAQLPA